MIKRLPTTTTTAASSLAPSTSYFNDVRPSKKRTPTVAVLPLTKKAQRLKRFKKPLVKGANKSKKEKVGIDKDEGGREQILTATQQNELPSTTTSSVSGTPVKHTMKRRSKSPDSSPPTKRTKKTKRK
uniref:Uncharacterized protein n=1 Tax=Romanomermis culicivorax TaxID=13658 RepID=A0A915HW70_ROMCU